MTAIVYQEKCVGRFMLFDQLTNAHHQLEMRVLRRDGEDVRVKRIVLTETLFQVLQFRQYKKIIGAPMKKKSFYFFVALR